MLSGSMLLTLSVVSVQPVLPKIEAALAVTDGDKLLVKMLVTIMGVTMVLGAPLAGMLGDKVRLGRLLIIAGVLYAVAGTAGLYLDNLYVLLATRLVVGLTAAGVATLSITLINKRMAGNERARWIGYHVSTAMLGSLIAYPIVGYLGDIGWRWTFIVYGAGLILAVFALVGLSDEAGPAGSSPSRADMGARDDANPLRWFPLWYVPLALAMGTVTFSPGVYLPFVVKEIGVTQPSIVAWVMLADAVVGSAMSFLFGYALRHLSHYISFIISFGFAGTGLLISAVTPNLTGIVVGTLFYGFGLGWFTPNLVTSLSRLVTRGQQGRAVGFAKGIHYLAAPTCLLALEPISRMTGPRGALMAGAILSFTVVAAFLYLTVRGGRAGMLAAQSVPTAAQ
jgi:predicted MFS family arabinose efflux permease